MIAAVDAIAVAHGAATWLMTGVIWYVQLVHYPAMAHVRTEPAGSFEAFERFHQRSTTRIVAPAMLLELACAVALPFLLSGWARGLALAGLALVAVNWVATAALQMPAHRRLEHGFNAAAHHRLVATNWLRTAAWSLRAALAAALLLWLASR